MRSRPALFPSALSGLVALVLLLSGCQLVDDAEDLQADRPSDGAAADVLGNPDEDFPSTIAELRAGLRPEALTWQDAPVLADVAVWLGSDEVTWERVRMTYVAADSDRMLTYRADPENLRLERPRLAGLQLLELPPAAVEEIQPLPDGTLEPAALAVAAADALRQCDASDLMVRAVLYATGAPAAWDGQEWSSLPAWRATVVTSSDGVSVDPASGRAFAPLTCVEPILLNE